VVLGLAALLGVATTSPASAYCRNCTSALIGCYDVAKDETGYTFCDDTMCRLGVRPMELEEAVVR
jgi:hypothetical protein